MVGGKWGVFCLDGMEWEGWDGMGWNGLGGVCFCGKMGRGIGFWALGLWMLKIGF